MRPHNIKRNFDPRSREDRDLYRNYLIAGGWGGGGCPFDAELPFLTVPDTINHKLILHALDIDPQKLVKR